MAILSLKAVPPRYDKNRNYPNRNATRASQRKEISFTCFDGEGFTGKDGVHRYQLLGVGQEQIEDSQGLMWDDIFRFVYDRYEPNTAFCGFFLGYDFTQWIKTFPEERAWRLLTIDGKASRKSKSPKLRGKYLPVDLDGWQVDILGSKRLQIRTKECDCPTVKCPHEKGPWMYLCDSGPFFQTSFLNVINPKRWETPVVSEDEWQVILEGKRRRATAVLDDDARAYNQLENEVLGRVLGELHAGLEAIDVHLTPRQWFGPGQAAQAWLGGRGPKRTALEDVAKPLPDMGHFFDKARAAYFGGWFEIMMHGTIPGELHEYDINSAYPHIIKDLPCLIHGTYSRGEGKPKVGEGELCLVRALVWTRNPKGFYPKHDKDGKVKGKVYIGAMLNRDETGGITRPIATRGWFWHHELEAAQSAGCISRISTDRFYEWVKYIPANCPPNCHPRPLREMAGLYLKRLAAGKDTPLGKGAKLVYNSGYGKFAQSIGEPMYGNPVYASLITAGCRTMILDAIATHPGGKANVAMVATDAVYFLDPHPSLPEGKALGEWEHTIRVNTTLFKPGVYWDESTREQVAKGEAPVFKARGVNAGSFAGSLARIDQEFAGWNGRPPQPFMFPGMSLKGSAQWPVVEFTANFAMITALQALTRGEWSTAGKVSDSQVFKQSSNPDEKRDTSVSWYDPERGIYRTEPGNFGNNMTAGSWNQDPIEGDSVPYEKRFGMEDPFSEERRQIMGVSEDGYVADAFFEALGLK